MEVFLVFFHGNISCATRFSQTLFEYNTSVSLFDLPQIFRKDSWSHILTLMGPVRIRHSSHGFGLQSSHSMDLAGLQAKIASIEICIP